MSPDIRNFFSLDTILHFLIDYDGFLVDSERLYFMAWCELLNDEGIEVCRDFHEGKHESEVYEKVKNYLKKPMTLPEVSEAKKVAYDNLIHQGKLQLTEGMKALLEKLKSVAPMSIVSNSTIEVVKAGVDSTGVAAYFERFFCYSEKHKRKPDPDLYNLALEELDLHNDSVLAFEDSISGILAAKAAGVSVVCINPSPKVEDYCRAEKVVYFKSAVTALNSIG